VKGEKHRPRKEAVKGEKLMPRKEEAKGGKGTMKGEKQNQ